jgi:hypothetical protein
LGFEDEITIHVVRRLEIAPKQIHVLSYNGLLGGFYLGFSRLELRADWHLFPLSHFDMV